MMTTPKPARSYLIMRSHKRVRLQWVLILMVLWVPVWADTYEMRFEEYTTEDDAKNAATTIYSTRDFRDIAIRHRTSKEGRDYIDLHLDAFYKDQFFSEVLACQSKYPDFIKGYLNYGVVITEEGWVGQSFSSSESEISKCIMSVITDLAYPPPPFFPFFEVIDIDLSQ